MTCARLLVLSRPALPHSSRVQVLKAAKDKLRLEQLVISKGKYKMVGEKTNRHEALKRKVPHGGPLRTGSLPVLTCPGPLPLGPFMSTSSFALPSAIPTLTCSPTISTTTSFPSPSAACALSSQELQNLLAYNPAKAALGKDGDKAISDAELSLVLSREAKATAAGHGFANVDAVTSTFDAARPAAEG